MLGGVYGREEQAGYQGIRHPLVGIRWERDSGHGPVLDRVRRQGARYPEPTRAFEFGRKRTAKLRQFQAKVGSLTFLEIPLLLRMRGVAA